MPALFPNVHNQVSGKKYKDNFSSVDELAVQPTLHDTWMCNVTSDNIGHGCRDQSASCGTLASLGECDQPSTWNLCRKTCGACSYCLTQWCHIDEAPASGSDSSLELCNCFEEGGRDPDEQDPARWPDEPRLVETLVVGRPREAWSQDLLSWFESQLGPGMWLGSNALRRPPLTQENWKSGGISVWPTFQAPAFLRMPSWPWPPAAPAAPDDNETATQTSVTQTETTATQTATSVTTTEMATAPGTAASSGTLTSTTVSTTITTTMPVPVIKQYCYCNGVSPCSSTRSQRRFVPLTDATTMSQTETTATATTSTAAAQAVGPIRRLDAGTPPSLWAGRRLRSASATCSVIWGLKVRDLSALDLFLETQKEQMWDLDPMFDPTDPWAQRSIRAMITGTPRDLAIVEDDVWFKQYEQWLLSTGGAFSFPSRQFEASMGAFLEQGGYAGEVLKEGSRIRALRVTFKLALEDMAPVDDALRVLEAWDSHVAAKNKVASMRAGDAWHASNLWVRARAQEGIVSSTAWTVTISVLVAYMAILLSTRDCFLSVLAMATSAMTILSLLFFMVAIMQWTIGVIEVVALIVFLGYLFSFTLHMSHAYKSAHVRHTNQRDERLERAREALKMMGRSLLGSSTTSAGCAIFLLFCTLQFFVRFGVIILGVTILSLVYALVFLPALLLTVGPTVSLASDGGDGGEQSGDKAPEAPREAFLALEAPGRAPAPSEDDPLQVQAEILGVMEQPPRPASSTGMTVDDSFINDEDELGDGAPLPGGGSALASRPATAPRTDRGADESARPGAPGRPSTAPSASRRMLGRSASFGGIGASSEHPGSQAFKAHNSGMFTPGTLGGSTTASIPGTNWMDFTIFGLQADIEEEEV